LVQLVGHLENGGVSGSGVRSFRSGVIPNDELRAAQQTDMVRSSLETEFSRGE
jgi:hypothetical protein